MKRNRIICALAAATLGLGSAGAFAQDRDHNWQRGGITREDARGDVQPTHPADSRYDSGNVGRSDNRYDNRNERRFERRDGRVMGNRGDYRNEDRYAYGARGPEWRRGGHIPDQYRSRQYVVEDWRSHRLNAPPRGYQWVQVGGDYVLVAIATGIIAQLLLNQ